MLVKDICSLVYSWCCTYDNCCVTTLCYDMKKAQVSLQAQAQATTPLPTKLYVCILLRCGKHFQDQTMPLTMLTGDTWVHSFGLAMIKNVWIKEREREFPNLH